MGCGLSNNSGSEDEIKKKQEEEKELRHLKSFGSSHYFTFLISSLILLQLAYLITSIY